MSWYTNYFWQITEDNVSMKYNVKIKPQFILGITFLCSVLYIMVFCVVCCTSRFSVQCVLVVSVLSVLLQFTTSHHLLWVQLLILSGGMFSDPLWWYIKTLLFLSYVSMLRTTFVDADALLQQQSIIDGLIHVMCQIHQFQLHHVIMQHNMIICNKTI